MALALDVALFVLCLRLLSGFLFLPCYAWPWRVAPTARAQVKGSKAEPLLLYTDRSPRAWATHRRNALLGQSQNGARVGGAVFAAVIFRLLRFPTTRIECATWRVVHDVGVMRRAAPARMHHIAVNGKGGGPRLPHKKE